jgi:hypothetical protein
MAAGDDRHPPEAHASCAPLFGNSAPERACSGTDSSRYEPFASGSPCGAQHVARPGPRRSVFWGTTDRNGSFFPVDGRLSGRVRRHGHSGRSRGRKIGQELTSCKSKSAGQGRGQVSRGQAIAGAAVNCSMRLTEPGRGANAQACRSAGRGGAALPPSDLGSPPGLQRPSADDSS